MKKCKLVVNKDKCENCLYWDYLLKRVGECMHNSHGNSCSCITDKNYKCSNYEGGRDEI